MCTVAAASIAACGGGGGGSTGGVAAPAAPVVQVTAQLVTSVPTPTYGATSEELIAFNYLNAERARCGFGKLAQSVPLDKAAKAHADYQLINNFLGHFENAGQYPNGFTGVRPSERIQFQGYQEQGGVTDEIADFLVTNSAKAGAGAKSVRTLLNAPYHAIAMLRGYRDIGMSIRSNLDVGSTQGRVLAQYNLAFKAVDGTQEVPAGTFSSYPCNGSIGVAPALFDEEPNPVPGRDLRASPLGTQSFFRAGQSDVLEMVSVKYALKTTGELVPLRTPLTSTVNPNPGNSIGRNEAIISADVTMLPNTTYIRTTVLKINGLTKTETAEFTTGM